MAIPHVDMDGALENDRQCSARLEIGHSETLEKIEEGGEKVRRSQY